ncbi:MAG: hypothetical protein JJT94_07820 [Bernardetiaceae bacterium]|nr:hypothetical protein [Bernardetiaceae bacterium]
MKKTQINSHVIAAYSRLLQTASKNNCKDMLAKLTHQMKHATEEERHTLEALFHMIKQNDKNTGSTTI